MTQNIRSCFLIALALLITSCGGNLTELAENMLYPFKDVNKKYPVPERAPDGFETLYLDVVDNNQTPMKINGWLYRAPNPNTAKVIIYFHGNGENLQALYQVQFLEKMKTLNSHFIVIDYPGLGRSTGSPNEFNLKNAAMATLDWSKNEFKNTPHFIWGRSLGASVAVLTTAARNSVIDGLILTSPWSTFIEMARALSSLVDQLPIEWLNKNKYDSVAAAALINKPTLIHHGIKDTLIPIQFGRKLVQSFSNPNVVTFVEIPELGHNDLFTSRIVWADIKSFLR